MARVCVALRLSSVSALAVVCGAAMAGADARPLLVPGRPVVVRPLGRTQVRRFRVVAGQFVHLSLEQRDLDIAAEASSASGGRIATGDEFEYGADSLSFTAPADDLVELRITVLARHSQDASYAILLDPPREPSPQDRSRQAAEQLSTAVKRALADPNTPSLAELLAQNRLATAAWHEIGDDFAEIASLIQAGDILHAMGDAPAALDWFLHALTLAQARRDQEHIAVSANGAGYCELLLGRIRESAAHLEEARFAATKSKWRYSEAAALNNLGMWYRRVGDFGASRRAYMESLSLTYAGDVQSRALLFNNIGLVQLSLAKYPESIEYLSRALILFGIKEYTARGKTLMNLGRAHLLAGSPRRAVRLCEQALRLVETSRDTRARADVLENLGQACVAARDPARARGHLEEAQKLYATLGDRRGQASAAHHLGLLWADSGDTAKGLELLRQAEQIREEIGLRDDAAETLYAMAQTVRKRKQLDLARQFSDRSLQIVESLRATISGEQLRSSYFSAKQPMYDFAVDLLMELHGRNPGGGFDRLAFEVFERARARSLLESLREARAGIRRGIDPALLAKEQQAQQTLNFRSQELSRLVSASHSASRELTLSQELDSARQSYESIEIEIREKSPNYASLVWPQPKGIGEIQRSVLDQDTILLEYGLGDQSSHLWAVTLDSVESFTLPGRNRLEPLARRIVRLAGDYRTRMRDPESARSYRFAVTALSEELLGPVASKLGRKRLLIVSSGILQRLPFAALHVPGDPERGRVPLGVRNELVSMSSASALVELRLAQKERPRPSLSIAVLADPVFDLQDPRVPPISGGLPGRLRSAGVPMARLPFTRDEAAQILKLAPVASSLRALGFDASRQTLLDPGIGRYRFLHIATHSILDEVHPELSGLVLSQVDRRGLPQDGYVRLNEIYNMPRLSCDLVTLPDCSTGLGKDVRGEGLIGLTRGFLYAGSPRVLVSLWACDDQATGELMGLVYQALLGPGKSTPAAALRSARETLWQRGGRWRDPYFSAGLVLYGEY